MLKRRTPLGWLQLAHHKSRFAVAIAGVAFAGILVFMQLGFLNMLIDTTVTIHKKLDADIVLVSIDGRDMVNAGSFPRRRLLQALGVEGVADVEALYIRNVQWIKPSDRESGAVLVLALRPDFPGFLDPELNAQVATLTLPGSALFDVGSRGDYTAFIEEVAAGARPQTEVNGKRVTIEGLFHFGASFAAESILLTSADTLGILDGQYDAGAVSIGLVQLAPGYDVAEVVAAINAVIGDDETIARSREDFIDHSRSRLAVDSPISFVFSFGAVIGLIVGTVIVVQILTSDVQDHMAEYATFKAMGFKTGYLLGIVYEQSAVLTLFGFLPALGTSLLLYEVISAGVGMEMTMTWERVLTVLGLTIAMCAFSGTLAMRRVVAADPAEVF
ncbi:MAG: ABC transporter permease DevC [Pseudomonadota bacterium]